jgi:hypothetical protein
VPPVAKVEPILFTLRLPAPQPTPAPKHGSEPWTVDGVARPSRVVGCSVVRGQTCWSTNRCRTTLFFATRRGSRPWSSGWCCSCCCFSSSGSSDTELARVAPSERVAVGGRIRTRDRRRRLHRRLPLRLGSRPRSRKAHWRSSGIPRDRPSSRSTSWSSPCSSRSSKRPRPLEVRDLREHLSSLRSPPPYPVRVVRTRNAPGGRPLCASCAPVTRKDSGRAETPVDFDGLRAAVTNTVGRRTQSGLPLGARSVNGGGGI